MDPDWIHGLLGGGLIGLAAALFLLGDGRIAGISGIAGGLLDALSRGGRGGGGGGGGRAARDETAENALFVLGLLAAPLVYAALGGGFDITANPNLALMAAAGLLVGFGARLGSGCTSGHGVCGAARLSPRSLAAMATFMAAGALTATLMALI